MASATNEGRSMYTQKINSGQIEPQQDTEQSVLVERKAFVFKANASDSENEQDSVVYSEDKTEEKA